MIKIYGKNQKNKINSKKYLSEKIKVMENYINFHNLYKFRNFSLKFSGERTHENYDNYS